MKHPRFTGRMSRFKKGYFMEKLKKVMTIMAMAGTVLVTGLFCYMPIRDILREQNKQEISLSESQAAEDAAEASDKASADAQDISGTTSEKPAVNTQDNSAADGQQQDTASEISGNSADVLQTEVLLSVKCGEQELLVSLWQGSDGICYFFLPGFAKEAVISLEGVGEETLLGNRKGSLFLGDAEIQAGDILTDIIWDVPYEMRVSEEENGAEVTVPVVFLCSSDLPVLSLTTRSGSMSYIDEMKGNEEAGSIRLLNEFGNELCAEEAESISGRGNSTWGLLKKPYQFKLKEEADLFGFGKAKTWALLANGYDETNLRNQIALGLASELGMSYVPDGRPVDLYINREYYGCYYLCEEVQIGAGRVEIQDLEETANLVYRTEEMNALTLSQNEDGSRKWAEIEYEDEDLSGGYLFERELEDRYAEEVSGFATKQGDYYALKSPKYASEAQVNYIGNLMQEFQDALQQEDGRHPVTGKHYSEYIDMTSFVQKYLVEEISKNYDGGVTSSFFYKPEDAVSSKIFAGPVWDYDVAFGNCNLDKIVSNPIGVSRLDDHIYDTDVFLQLYEKEEFYARVVALYEEKALPYLNDLLDGGIDRMVEETRAASEMNHIRWQELSNRYQYYTDYDHDVRYLKYFIETRRDFLNEVWLEDAVYHRLEYQVDGDAYKVDYVKDGELPAREPVAYKNSAVFAGWVIKGSGVPFDEYKPIYEDMIFEALWQEVPVDGEEVAQ